MDIRAPVKLDKKTKNLAGRIEEGNIAIIDHRDLDEVAANSLINKKVAAVINCEMSISGRYPNLGPSMLEKAKVNIYDVIKGDLFDVLKDGDSIIIKGDKIFFEDREIATLLELTSSKISQLLAMAETNLEIELEKFIDNTLTYAHKEKDFILGKLNIPMINTVIQDKQVLVVVRGQDYRKDLSAVLPYIKEMKPILIGVDGGADALLEFGFAPDIIIGDMDSVTDRCLKVCKEIIVHAYPNGKAPGLERVQQLNLNGITFPAPGTSEDIAMLLAYEKGADLIVAVGTHSNMIDFLEKGRKGMASTFLVRLKVGSKLVDARGVSKLYHRRITAKHILWMIFAALTPIIITLSISQPVRNLLKLLMIRFRILLGI
ncbi:thiamin pyrophosphokinase [Clostridium aceticum]|uniref:Thiamin pyrophosphokinase n=1 Tax=Clostridium aceticum TaxID=84022 RepID=A0A0D8IG02_9CLOT|nr:putative cytokinetic ring protein SteA [Clostridium aceticum]AKL95314.1 thiamin pyrophosphokinase [Clostridium aceticum]KJF28156.1 thiamin pyrophosphokinase [Clostridium aceticum]